MPYMDAIGLKDEINLANPLSYISHLWCAIIKEEPDHWQMFCCCFFFSAGREGQNLGHQKTARAEPKVPQQEMSVICDQKSQRAQRWCAKEFWLIEWTYFTTDVEFFLVDIILWMILVGLSWFISWSGWFFGFVPDGLSVLIRKKEKVNRILWGWHCWWKKPG